MGQEWFKRLGEDSLCHPELSDRGRAQSETNGVVADGSAVQRPGSALA